MTNLTDKDFEEWVEKLNKTETGMPDFIFCGVCLTPRDVYLNVDKLWVVEECEKCGDEHYAYSQQPNG